MSREAVIEYAGSKLLAEVTEEGLYRCPLCGALFATAKDLISHLIAHAMGYPDARKAPPER